MNQLHVTADDWGLHPDINSGIADAVRARTVSGISVCAQGQCTDWERLRGWSSQGIEIGLHVTLVGEPWLSGRTVSDWRALVRLLLFGGRSFLDAVRTELAQQVSVFRDAGMVPAHLDSHQHVHVYPALWRAFRDVAAGEGIPRIRLPLAPRGRLVRPTPAGWALQFLASRCVRPDAPTWRCVGLKESGHNTMHSVARELRIVGPVDLELVAHPGVTTLALEERYASWGYDWSGERAMLVDPSFPDVVLRHGYEIAGREKHA